MMTLFDKPDLLKNRRILLAISASISAYKALDLISSLKKLGAKVRVVMSEESKKFITPLSFEALTHSPVLHADSESWSGDITNPDSKDISCNHISYAKWAELLIIIPASANTIAKIAHGIADNIMLSTILACNAKKLLAPAMNTQMLQNLATQDNINILKNRGFEIIPTRSALLACDTYGDGALSEIDQVIFKSARALLIDQSWEGKNIFISGGGSVESIDSIRYISNHSSGLMASALAIALYLKGAEVSFISSSFPTTLPDDVKKISVKSSKDYLHALEDEIKKITSPSYLFMAAAIADFIPNNPINGKIKKTSKEKLELICDKNIDILTLINHPKLKKIGFKAEFDSQNSIANATYMLEQKKCEAVCLNTLSKHNAFGSKQNTMVLISKNKQVELPLANKLEIALQITNFIAEL